MYSTHASCTVQSFPTLFSGFMATVIAVATTTTTFPPPPSSSSAAPRHYPTPTIAVFVYPFPGALLRELLTPFIFFSDKIRGEGPVVRNLLIYFSLFLIFLISVL